MVHRTLARRSQLDAQESIRGIPSMVVKFENESLRPSKFRARGRQPNGPSLGLHDCEF